MRFTGPQFWEHHIILFTLYQGINVWFGELGEPFISMNGFEAIRMAF
jgi:hypothetical protein